MPYRPAYSLDHETRPIVSASLKAAFTGALLITILLGSPMIFAGAESPGLWLGGIPVLGLVYAIAFMAGFLATALCMTLFGPALARLMGDALQRPLGLIITMGSAFALSVCFALFVASREVFTWSAIALAYALPAAILYRREVLCERALS